MGNSEAYNRHYAEQDTIDNAPHRFDNPQYLADLRAYLDERRAEREAQRMAEYIKSGGSL